MGDAFFDADGIRAASFVRHVEIHDTLGSTNDRAAELARDPSVKLPALVVARLQTAGRGRGQNTWWSADGALTFSVLLEPAALGIGTANWPQLSLTTAVAVCDALWVELKTIEPQPGESLLGIKWPNDIMLDGGKVCGILIESPGGSAPAKNRLIVGIGINVNNSWTSAPRNLAHAGIALCDLTARRHSTSGIIIGLLSALEQRMDQLATCDPQLSKAWQKRCCLVQQRVRVKISGRSIDGICHGIAEDGALLVHSTGASERFYGGTLELT